MLERDDSSSSVEVKIIRVGPTDSEESEECSDSSRGTQSIELIENKAIGHIIKGMLISSEAGEKLFRYPFNLMKRANEPQMLPQGRKCNTMNLQVPSLCNTNQDISDSRRITCVINTMNVYSYSSVEELLSSFKLDLAIVVCLLIGIGHGGRINVNSWFAIFETIHTYPAAFVTAALSDAVFIIRRKTIHRWLSFALPFIFHIVLFTATQFDLLIWGQLINIFLVSAFMLTVFSFCSVGIHIRVTYFFFWFTGMLLFFSLIVTMLFFKLWIILLWTIIPADYFLTKMAANATKTCDRLVFLKVSAIIYCCVFETIRFLSLYGIVEEQEGQVNFSWYLSYFWISDVLCTFISKSELVYCVKWKLGLYTNTPSETRLLACRITRACVNVTSLCLPIWSVGFDVGLLLLGDKPENVEINVHENVLKRYCLLLVMHYTPEFLSELGLYLYSNSLCAKVISPDQYRFERLNFIRSLESNFLIASYFCVPGILIAIRVIEDQGVT